MAEITASRRVKPVAEMRKWGLREGRTLLQKSAATLSILVSTGTANRHLPIGSFALPNVTKEHARKTGKAL
jgi:hypothetical protein